MARQANASYEGNGQRRSLDIENALKRLTQLEGQLKGIEAEITEITQELENKLNLSGGIIAGSLHTTGYLYQYGLRTKDTSSDKSGYWYKLFTFSIRNQFNSSGARAIIFTEGDGSFTPSKSVIIQCRLKQQSAMGTEPQRGIALIASDRFTTDQFRICIVENTSSITKAEVWVKIANAYQVHIILPECIYEGAEISDDLSLHQFPPTCTYYSEGTLAN